MMQEKGGKALVSLRLRQESLDDREGGVKSGSTSGGKQESGSGKGICLT